MKLIHHRLGIRPVGFVELPVTLYSPVEKVDHNLVNPDAFLLILSRNGKYFLLGTIAQLALPQAHQLLREHRCPACHGCILCQEFLRVFPGSNPVIHLFCAAGNPFCLVPGKGDPAYRRVIPQKTVSQGTDHKGNRNLTVALGQFKHRAFQVQEGLLVLSHAIDLFIFVGIKTNRQLIIAAPHNPFPFTVNHFQAAAGLNQCSAVRAVVFPQDQFSVSVKTDHSGKVDSSADPSVFNLGAGNFRDGSVPDPKVLFADSHPGGCFRRFFCKSPVAAALVIHYSTHPQCIRSPCFDPQCFPAFAKNQAVLFFLKAHFVFLLSLLYVPAPWQFCRGCKHQIQVPVLPHTPCGRYSHAGSGPDRRIGIHPCSGSFCRTLLR